MRVFLLLAVALALAVLGAAVAPVLAADAPRAWLRPLDGPVLRAFAVGPDRFAAGQHRGVDLGAPPGAPVLAACGGRVSFAGTVPRGGRTASVRCRRLVATYQHLGALAVRRGQVVLRGGRIGTVGHARPRPHVHLGARDAASGAYLDPLALIGGAPRELPPLLPSARRRPPGLGRAPRAPRALPLGQRPASLRVPLARPAATLATLAVPPAAPASARRLPWPVWLGLTLFALGLPLGGGIVTLRRRRRRSAPSAVVRAA